MTTTESDRLEMHLGLKNILGDKVANTVMEHLPPTGWADVARKSDVEYLARRIDGVVHAIWAMAALSSAQFIALFTILAAR